MADEFPRYISIDDATEEVINHPPSRWIKSSERLPVDLAHHGVAWIVGWHKSARMWLRVGFAKPDHFLTERGEPFPRGEITHWQDPGRPDAS